MNPSLHRPGHTFSERAAQRGLRADVLEFILSFGTEMRGADAQFLTVRRRNLPTALQTSRLARAAEPWVVVLSTSGKFLTCYCRRHPTRYIKARKLARQH